MIQLLALSNSKSLYAINVQKIDGHMGVWSLLEFALVPRTKEDYSRCVTANDLWPLRRKLIELQDASRGDFRDFLGLGDIVDDFLAIDRVSVLDQVKTNLSLQSFHQEMVREAMGSKIRRVLPEFLDFVDVSEYPAEIRAFGGTVLVLYYTLWSRASLHFLDVQDARVL